MAPRRFRSRRFEAQLRWQILRSFWLSISITRWNEAWRAAGTALHARSVSASQNTLLTNMLACLRTAAVFGVDACPVRVEVDVSFGFPTFTMVGLPDASVRESRDRVRSAIRNSGFEFPAHRITVNLAPADVRKAGASFDLPIALGILAAQGVVERRHISDLVLLGELSLDGSFTPHAACCRSPPRRNVTVLPAFSFRRRMPARPRSCRASTCFR